MYGYFRQIQSKVSLHCLEGIFDSISCIVVSGPWSLMGILAEHRSLLCNGLFDFALNWGTIMIRDPSK